MGTDRPEAGPERPRRVRVILASVVALAVVAAALAALQFRLFHTLLERVTYGNTGSDAYFSRRERVVTMPTTVTESAYSSTVVPARVEWFVGLRSAYSTEGNAVICTQDHGFLAVGSTDDGRTCLVKVDSHGLLGWRRLLPEVPSANGRAVSELPNGDYIVAGQHFSGAFTMRTDSVGRCRRNWVYSYTRRQTDGQDPDVLEALPANDGGWIVYNGTELIRFDGRGRQRWRQRVPIRSWCGGGPFDHNLLSLTSGGTSVVQTHGGEYRTLGPQGDLDSCRILLPGAPGQGLAIAKTRDSGYVAIGYGVSPVRKGRCSDIYLEKSSLVGKRQWLQVFGTGQFNYGKCVVQAPDGGFITGCIKDDHDGWGGRGYIVKFDSSGSRLWSLTLDQCSDVRGLCVSEDGAIVATGSLNEYGPSGRDHLYLLKLR
jgi:hypothetical protein